VSTAASVAAAASQANAALVGVLSTAVQNAAVGGVGVASRNAVMGSTSTNDIMLDTSGTVQLSSGSCSNADLCGAVDFAATLKQALAAL
jgi:hypothetical protein